MYQTVTKILTTLDASEEQVVIRAIPDVRNDRNDISKQTIYRCAVHQLELFEADRLGSLKPTSYLDRIFFDLYKRSCGFICCDNENAYQVLFAICMIIRLRKPISSHECSFADNLYSFLATMDYFSEFTWKLEDDYLANLRDENKALLHCDPSAPMSITKPLSPTVVHPTVNHYHFYIQAPVENLFANIEKLTNQNDYE